MRVLVLTVTAGEGHNNTARALAAQLERRGAECKVVDACYYVSNMLGTVLSCGYLLSIDKLSVPYSVVYKKLEKRAPDTDPKSFSKLPYRVVANKLEKLINEFSPDVIVCTHIFAGLSVGILKSENRISAVTIGVVTDFTVHPYWEDIPMFDYFVLPSERLEWQCAKKSLKSAQLLPFGIPIREEFLIKVEKAEARRRLGLLEDKPVIMVMGGSMGYGGISETVARIDRIRKCFQMIVVCGNNEKELKKIRSVKNKHPRLAVGFTDNIPLMMDASDCIVSKPGGLSVSEALSKSLPLILTTPIPGHEERNSAFLINTGAAMGISSNSPVEELVWQFLSDEKARERMNAAAASMGHADAAGKLADFIVGLG